MCMAFMHHFSACIMVVCRSLLQAQGSAFVGCGAFIDEVQHGMSGAEVGRAEVVQCRAGAYMRAALNGCSLIWRTVTC